MQPSMLVDKEIAHTYSQDYMFMACIDYIHQVIIWYGVVRGTGAELYVVLHGYITKTTE